ncbi:MAG TPA: ATP-binding protein [Fermentimonas sp.]|nr:ATP-binding protein [Fermentimonas sp.]
MKREKASKVKFTVILGYLLVVIVLISGLIAINGNLIDFSNKRVENDDLSELILIGNTLSLLYEAESEQSILTASNAQQYLIKYDSITPLVEANLQELYWLSQDSIRKIKLDSIYYLIGTKRENLNDIVLLLDSIGETPKIVTETYSSYESKGQNKYISEIVKERNGNSTNENKSDTTVIRKGKKRFLERLRNVFVAEPDSTIIIENRHPANESDINVIIDTVVNKVRYSERLDMSRHLKLQADLMERQNIMNNTNRLLTLRIDELLKQIEQEEINKSIELLKDKEIAISNSQSTLRLVSVIAILIVLLFAILFFIDINKSQLYRKELEESNVKISELLTTREKLMLTISHDIKAPTSSILGFIELMEDNLVEDSPNNKIVEYLHNMKSSATHIMQLVLTLLNYHKLQRGKWQIRNINFNLHNIINNITDSFRPIAEQKNLQYQVNNLIPYDKVFYGDPYALRQILSNIISNAIKYTTKGEVSIVADEDPLNKLYFSVLDTGVGIDFSDQKTVFNEFQQIDAESGESNSAIEGSGLGLAITKNLVSILQGEIKLISEKGVGSEFIVEIPFRNEDDNQKSVLTNHSVSSEILESTSVLVIDDDPTQMKMVSEMIKKMGIKCTTETDPENVYELLKNNKFDILLTDINLQVTTGIELVKQIKEKDERLLDNIPLVALSADSVISKDEIKELGFADFLPKPFTYNELYEVIYRYVFNNNVNSRIKYSDNETTEKKDSFKGVEALIEYVKEDDVVSSDILQTFVNETTDSCALLEDAFKELNFETASKVTHKMIPLFRMIENENVIELMELLEKEKYLTKDEQLFLLDELKRIKQEAVELKNKINKK